MNRRVSRLRHALLAGVTLALVGIGGDVAHGYLRTSTTAGTRRLLARWTPNTVRYVVNPRGVPGVTGAQLQATMQRAFGRWQDVPSAAVSFQYGGATSAEPGDFDGFNTIGFLDAPGMQGVLGVTLFVVDIIDGEFVEADIFFNASVPWSVRDGGDPDAYDLESVAVHEAGHFLGLDHSALGYFEVADDEVRLAAAETVMFPFAFDPGNTSGRALRPDDIAGVSEIYPDADFTSETGTLSGRVRLQGGGVFGAHVMAFNPITGAMVGGFSLTRDGDFAIAGLSPGRYVVRVEPVDDEDVGGYFEDPFSVDLDFRTMFFDRFVGVPEGAASTSIDLQVQRR